MEKCECLKKQYNHLRDEPCDICGKTYVDLAKEVIDKAVTPHREDDVQVEIMQNKETGEILSVNGIPLTPHREEHTEWEKEFDEKLGVLDIVQSDWDVLKSFIHSLLKDQRERIREEIEKEKKHLYDRDAFVFKEHNKVLDTILNLPSLKDDPTPERRGQNKWL